MVLTRVKLSYEEYLSLPESNRPCELVDGELYMPPSPNTRHQEIIGRLYERLNYHVEERYAGKVLFAPLDVVLDKARPLVVQPDLVFISNERSGIVGPRIEGAPDLVVEVFSPTSAVRDRTEKSVWYSQYGVQEYWLVDPDAQAIEVRRLAPGGYEPAGTFHGGETLQSVLLPGLRIALAEVFGTSQSRP